MNPMGTEAIVAAYNEFRSQIVLLQELKSTLQTAEFELETLRNRLTEEGKEVQLSFVVTSSKRFLFSCLSSFSLFSLLCRHYSIHATSSAF